MHKTLKDKMQKERVNQLKSLVKDKTLVVSVGKGERLFVYEGRYQQLLSWRHKRNRSTYTSGMLMLCYRYTCFGLIKWEKCQK